MKRDKWRGQITTSELQLQHHLYIQAYAIIHFKRHISSYAQTQQTSNLIQRGPMTIVWFPTLKWQTPRIPS